MIELAHVRRNEQLESRHRGSIIVIGPGGASDGSAVGAVDEPMLPRSSLKPVQAVAMVECGFAGRDESLALACASHDGEPVHIEVARATLAAAGLTETALQCPPDLPDTRDALLAWVRAGGAPASICHNCSGKHSAMVSTCAGAGWPVESYIDPAHPLQQAIRERLARLAGGVAGVAVDGCGAPAFAVTLRGLAQAFATLATSDEEAPALVAGAMRAHPLLLGGSQRAVSALGAAVPGLIAKEGAEGVWAAALPDGRAFAAKIDDGGGRALPVVLAAVLRHWGFEHEVIERWSHVDVLGGGRRVGAVTPAPELLAFLENTNGAG